LSKSFEIWLDLETGFSFQSASIAPQKEDTGIVMFVLRSLFWLATVVLLLPPSADDNEPTPRVSLLHTAYAARVLLQDVTGVCERHPEACETSREALVLLTQKLETGAEIVSAGIAAGQTDSAPAADHGTLTTADLEPAWTAADDSH
jgi:hypothetical protein